MKILAILVWRVRTKVFFVFFFFNHLTKFSGIRGWKVNGTRLFGSFQRKIFSYNGIFEKVALFFWTEGSKRKFVFHFFKDIFDLSSQISRLADRFSENRTDSYKRLKRSTRFRNEIYQS